MDEIAGAIEDRKLGLTELTDDQKLFGYQRRWINDESKYAIAEKARRTGFTWAEAIASVLYCLKTKNNCWFSSSDEKNSKEFILYVKQTCECINAILGFSFISLAEATTECVYLPNGSRITAVSSAPKAIRGKDGRIVLDEMAHHEDQEELYRAAQGSVIQKGCLRIMSTHNGPASLFYRLCQGSPENGFSKHRVTLKDACDEGYAEKFATHLHHLLPNKEALTIAFLEEVKRGCSSEDAFLQEFMCEPLSLKALISAEEYDKLALWDVPDELEDRKYNNLFCGIDVGRVHDLTVVWVLEEYINPNAASEWEKYDYKTVCVKWIKNMPIPAQYEIIKPILCHPDVTGIEIDIGTIGRTLSDLVTADLPFAKPVAFTNGKKAEMAERVKGFVQYQRISLPKDNELIRTDMLSMRRKVSNSGWVIYEGGTKETHADFFWSCGLACDAAVAWSGIQFMQIKNSQPANA
jgi:phage FluMu gp28-like protein